MKIIKSIKVSLLLWVVALCPAISYADSESQCRKVDCDCSSVPQGQWRQLCEVRETLIISECNENSGRVKTYCGLHGPLAFPVATSLQKSLMLELSSQSTPPEVLSKAIESQLWSITQDFNSMQAQESEGKVGKAAQVFNIYRNNSRKYFGSQLSLLSSPALQKDPAVFAGTSRQFAAQSQQLSQNMAEFSDTLWRNSFKVNDETLIKPYRSFAFKVLREAATQAERSAEIWAKVGEFELAARQWQNSVEITRKLLKWEGSTTNNPKYVAFYQKQATSRLNRATLYWLKVNAVEKVAENMDSVDESLLKVEKMLLENSLLRQDLQASRVD